MSLARRGARRIHWERHGEAGPAIVLVPGTGAGARQFGALPKRFARAGLRCLTISPVGVPPSSPHTGSHDFEAAALDLLAVLDAAAIERATPVAVSFGGTVALSAAALAPERIPSVVLVGSALSGSPRARYVRRFFRTAAEHLGPEEMAAVLAPFLFGRRFFERHETLVADIVRGMRPDAVVRDLIVAQSQSTDDLDRERLLRAVRCPTLCLAGADDVLVLPEEVRATAEALAEGRFAEIPDVGHSLLLESNAAFDQVVAFVQSGS
jgi:pimeloyl-ACP methyl ester carboxylesterase